MHALDSVHTRHLVIHQDDMIVIFQSLLQGFRSGGDRNEIYLCLPEKLGYDHKIGCCIIYDEHFRFRGFERLHINMFLVGFFPVQNVKLSHRLVQDDLLGDLNYEGRAFRINTVDRDLSAHEIYELLDDGKT